MQKEALLQGGQGVRGGGGQQHNQAGKQGRRAVGRAGGQAGSDRQHGFVAGSSRQHGFVAGSSRQHGFVVGSSRQLDLLLAVAGSMDFLHVLPMQCCHCPLDCPSAPSYPWLPWTAPRPPPSMPRVRPPPPPPQHTSTPMGALKAAATPTDTPAVTKSRLSFGFLKRLNRPVLKPSVVLWPWKAAGRQAGASSLEQSGAGGGS